VTCRGAHAVARIGEVEVGAHQGPAEGRLDAKRKLSLVRVVSPLGYATLLDIRDLVSVLLQQAGANSSAATCANEQHLAG
jgi:hypothetical protein